MVIRGAGKVHFYRRFAREGGTGLTGLDIDVPNVCGEVGVDRRPGIEPQFPGEHT